MSGKCPRCSGHGDVLGKPSRVNNNVLLRKVLSLGQEPRAVGQNRLEWVGMVQREPKVRFMQWTQCASTETILDMKQSVFECICKPWWKANKDQLNGGSNGSRKLLELASLMFRCHVQQKQTCHWKTLFVHFSRYY